LYHVEIKDDGIGIPDEKLDLKKQKSLGMTLISELSRQLKAQIQIQSNNGTSFEMKFEGKH
jgi:two-component sensor histidine kinase